MGTGDKLIEIVRFLATNGVSIVGSVKKLADVLFPGHALTNEQINAAEQVAIAEDDAIIRRREPMAKPDADPAGPTGGDAGPGHTSTPNS